LSGKKITFEQYFEALNRWYKVTAYSDEPGHFTAIFDNITAEKQELASLKGLLKMTEKLVDLDAANINYREPAEVMKELSGARYVAINTYNENLTETTTRAIVGLSSSIRYASELMGFDLVGKSWEIMPERLRKIEGGKLVRFDSIYETSMGTISKKTASLLHKVFNLGDIYVIELAYGGKKILGDIIFFMPRRRTLKNPEAVELYAGQLGSLLAKLRADEKLAESEKKYRYIADNITDVVWTADLNLNITYISPSVERFTGFTPQEYMRKSPEELFAPDSLAELMEILREEFAREKDPHSKRNRSRVIEVEHYNKGGYTDWAAIHASFIRDEETQEITGLLGVTRDISERKKAEESLHYQLRVEKLISDISSHFVSLPAEKLNEGINDALKLAGEFFEVDRCYVFQFSTGLETRSMTHEWCAEGIKPQKDILQDQPLADLPWWTKKLKAKSPVRIPDVEDLPPEAAAEKAHFKEQQLRSLICVPIIREDELIGALGFDSMRSKWYWTGEHETLLRVFAELISGNLDRYRAFEEIYYMSYFDQLTGLYNRRFLAEEMKRLDSERLLPISMIVADLNGLKLVNDTYGHDVGDKMLSMAANIIKESCRKEDVIARWGGDEFVVLLPRTTEEQVKRICGRIKARCGESYVEEVPVSLALGVAVKDSEGTKLQNYLKTAEDEMYKQKLAESRSNRSAVVNTLLRALAEKSYESEGHVWRMQELAFRIGEKIGLPDSELNRLELLITLHDIGKIKIPEEILTKESPLTDEEWAVIKKHPETGFKIARSTEEFAHVAEEILAHHEHWDGSGYPQGLAGEDIPLLARITTLVDALDVMFNGRQYKKAMDKEEIIAELRRCAGRQFDPQLVDVLVEILHAEVIRY